MKPRIAFPLRVLYGNSLPRPMKIQPDKQAQKNPQADGAECPHRFLRGLQIKLARPGSQENENVILRKRVVNKPLVYSFFYLVATQISGL